MKHFPFTVRFGSRSSTDQPYVLIGDIAIPLNVGAGTLYRPNSIAVHAVGDVLGLRRERFLFE